MSSIMSTSGAPSGASSMPRMSFEPASPFAAWGNNGARATLKTRRNGRMPAVGKVALSS